MASEHAPQHLRWRLTLLVGALVACVGAACVLWLLWHVERSAAQAGVQEWRAIATSVAQSQARQFGRAVRLGIPLPELPGVPAHFEGVLQRQPVLAAMALELADGRVLHQVRHPQRLVALDEAAVRVPVNAVAPPASQPPWLPQWCWNWPTVPACAPVSGVQAGGHGRSCCWWLGWPPLPPGGGQRGAGRPSMGCCSRPCSRRLHQAT